jgi:tRNA G46 methylase TrmB
VLDSFCGTGQSTAILAQQYPHALVAGVDQSVYRLDRHQAGKSDNYLLLRAQAEDIWQLLLADGIQLRHHFLLYPNPWPKQKHLQRRIHGHASFSWLLRLGGSIELRSNWQLYTEEFGIAMHLAGRRGRVCRIAGDSPLTRFEEKYWRSGHSLWCYRCGPPVTKQEEYATVPGR